MQLRWISLLGSGKIDVRSLQTHKFALQMSLEGLGFRAIGRVLDVSNVTGLKWIRAYSRQASEIQSSQEVEVVELDMLHTYIGQKNTAGYGVFINANPVHQIDHAHKK